MAAMEDTLTEARPRRRRVPFAFATDNSLATISCRSHCIALLLSFRAQPAKLLLLASLLAKDRIITENGKAFLKGAHVRRPCARARLADVTARARA